MKLFNQLLSFIASTKPNTRWLKLLIVLAIMLAMMMYKHKYAPTQHAEGFAQNERYVLKRDADKYDEFYVAIYDYLHKTDKRCPYEMKHIVESTQPDKSNSVILDVGCGTGCMVDVLREAGYRAFGVDKSQAMVEFSRQKYPKTQIKLGDANDSMAYDRETFTHILCMNKTIYEFPDKVAFFRNCYHWLVPGGYLVVHTVHATKFDPIVPAGKPAMLDNPQAYAKERITDTVIDFADFKYRSAYDFTQADQTGKTVHTESFTDKETGHIRENEHTVVFEPENRILETAQFCRFVSYGMFSMKDYNGDAHQNVYIFQKI